MDKFLGIVDQYAGKHDILEKHLAPVKWINVCDTKQPSNITCVTKALILFIKFLKFGHCRIL
jgi:hypothetical protein